MNASTLHWAFQAIVMLESLPRWLDGLFGYKKAGDQNLIEKIIRANAAEKPAVFCSIRAGYILRQSDSTGEKLFPRQFWHAWHAATAWFRRTHSAKSMEPSIDFAE